MVIVYYDYTNNCIYLCSNKFPLKSMPLQSNILQLIDDNESILYVQNGSLISKKTLTSWLSGNSPPDNSYVPTQPQPATQGAYMHPAHNGVIVIEDILTDKFPHGVKMTHKWDFISVDEVGKEILESSAIFRSYVSKGKIKIVPYSYAKQHMHKKKRYKSPAEMAVESILIQDDRRGSAEKTASSGGFYSSDDAIEIEVN